MMRTQLQPRIGLRPAAGCAPLRGGGAEGRLGGNIYSICVTNFVVKYPSKVSVPPSEPMPLSFTPPKGVSAKAWPKWLMLTIPASMPFCAASAFLVEVVNTYYDSP